MEHDLNSVRYSFAIDVTKGLIHIRDAKRHSMYICCGCKEIVTPILGSYKRHHFRHLNSECNYETYLHKAAKHAFYFRFNAAKEVGKPFGLELSRPIVCQSKHSLILRKHHLTCNSVVPAYYDLTAIFKNAFLEKFDTDTGLRPDVLLECDSFNRKCYVEIFVTHECSEAKIAQMIPIIEIRVKDEGDITFIRNGDFKVTDNRLTFYNFSVEPKIVSQCHQHCSQKHTLFSEWNHSGLGRLHRKTWRFEELHKNPFLGLNIWPDSLPNEKQLDKIREYLLSERLPLSYQNCVLCKHAVSWLDGKVFCLNKNRMLGYMNAQTCIEQESFHEKID